MAASRLIAFVGHDGMQLLDFSGPAGVFETANSITNQELYRSRLVTVNGRTVAASNGLRIESGPSIWDLNEHVDTALVVGGLRVDPLSRDREFVEALRFVHAATTRVGSVCIGAIPLAAAGILDGYRATTHWSHCAALSQRFPEVTIESDKIYVHDRDRWTSAGVTAGIDLALALVRADHGPELSHEVARWMVVYANRAGGQRQFDTSPDARTAQSELVSDAQRWINRNLNADLTVHTLAARASMSERHFARRFGEETGVGVGQYIQTARLERAIRLLELTDGTVEQIAREVGYRNGETLHRLFVRRMSTTPQMYRRRFSKPEDS